MMLTRSTRVPVMGGVLTGPPPEIHHQLLGLTDVQREVVVVTPVSQGVHLFSVSWFIVISDQTYHRCVIWKFDDVGPVCGYTVVCVQGVQKRAENTALRGSSVSGSVGRRCCYLLWAPAICLLGIPGSSCAENCSDLEPEFHYKLRGHYGIKCWTVVNKQHSHVCVPLVKMGKSSVQGEGKCILSGAVIAVGELKWVEWCW